MNKTLSNFLVGFLARAAAGAIAGILFAPGKGSETRHNILKKVRELSDEFGLGLGEMMDGLNLETEPATEPVSKTRGRKAASKQSDAPKRKSTRKTTND
jgi:gas vesicle protein